MTAPVRVRIPRVQTAGAVGVTATVGSTGWLSSTMVKAWIPLLVEQAKILLSPMAIAPVWFVFPFVNARSRLASTSGDAPTALMS